MTTGASLVPPPLRAAIEQSIVDSQNAWTTFVDANRMGAMMDPLAVKYVSSRFASNYLTANKGLFIGSNDFTWGRGVYVTGVEEPLSTAIYGRVGVISRFQPSGWRAFDARVEANLALYLNWLHVQPDYPEAVLTVHSNHWLHQFRNTFREQFRIDVVLFHPDEHDSRGWYTNATHTWLAVSDWKAPGRIAQYDFSLRFLDAQLTILAEEEFETDATALTRKPLLAISGAAPVPPSTLRNAYEKHDIVRILS